MDESMTSVHSISAMDISPASSPRTAINPMISNPLVLNAFQQQQQLLSNIEFNPPIRNDYSSINKNPISDEYENIHSKSIGLYSTVLTDNIDEIKSSNIHDEVNELRKRIPKESLPSIIESTSTIKQSELKSSRRSFKKILFFIFLLLISIYFFTSKWNQSILLPRSTNWQNASEYLTQNLIGQDQGLQQFKDAMATHKNFSVVLIEGPIGTGKTYLASSLEKFLPTSLISANTLIGLSPHHWTESERLSSYLLSHLTPTLFQFLILDDLDLLPNDEKYCQTLTTALHLINNNNNQKNLFILLLQTGSISNLCKEYFDNLITKSIQFNMLQKHHIRKCIQNEAYAQNVQPKLTEEQIEKILNSLKYIEKEGVLYSTTGCKEIPSFVMLASKQHSY